MLFRDLAEFVANWGIFWPSSWEMSGGMWGILVEGLARCFLDVGYRVTVIRDMNKIKLAPRNITWGGCLDVVIFWRYVFCILYAF